MHLTRFVLIVYAFSSKNERYAFRFYYITHSEVTIFLDGSIFVRFLWLETDFFPLKKCSQLKVSYYTTPWWSLFQNSFFPLDFPKMALVCEEKESISELWTLNIMIWASFRSKFLEIPKKWLLNKKHIFRKGPHVQKYYSLGSISWVIWPLMESISSNFKLGLFISKRPSLLILMKLTVVDW